MASLRTRGAGVARTTGGIFFLGGWEIFFVVLGGLGCGAGVEFVGRIFVLTGVSIFGPPFLAAVRWKLLRNFRNFFLGDGRVDVYEIFTGGRGVGGSVEGFFSGACEFSFGEEKFAKIWKKVSGAVGFFGNFFSQRPEGGNF